MKNKMKLLIGIASLVIIGLLSGCVEYPVYPDNGVYTSTVVTSGVYYNTPYYNCFGCPAYYGWNTWHRHPVWRRPYPVRPIHPIRPHPPFVNHAGHWSNGHPDNPNWKH